MNIIWFSVFFFLFSLQTFSKPLPRITIKNSTGPNYLPYFIDSNGNSFTPRGVDYNRIYEECLAVPLPHPFCYYTTFTPSIYNISKIEQDFEKIQQFGYNSLRVFLDSGSCIEFAKPGNRSNDYDPCTRNDSIAGFMDNSTPLFDPYMDNVADFLMRATKHNLYIIFVLDFFPRNNYFLKIASQSPNPNFQEQNAYYLHGGHIKAKAEYAIQFIFELRKRVGPAYLTTVFAYMIDNEAHFDASVLPFNTLNLTVTTADGKSYNMGNAIQRQACADSNFNLYVDTVTDAIHNMEHQSLVTTGMFTFNAVGRKGPNGLLPIPKKKEEPRFPVRPYILSSQTKLDFLDVHIYPSGPLDIWSLQNDLASEEWSKIDFTRLPFVMAEFGAFKFVYPTMQNASINMQNLQVQSCAFNFQGWLYWSWDTQQQSFMYRLVDENYYMNQYLAPIYRYNPCLR